MKHYSFTDLHYAYWIDATRNNLNHGEAFETWAKDVIGFFAAIFKAAKAYHRSGMYRWCDCIRTAWTRYKQELKRHRHYTCSSVAALEMLRKIRRQFAPKKHNRLASYYPSRRVTEMDGKTQASKHRRRSELWNITNRLQLSV